MSDHRRTMGIVNDIQRMCTCDGPGFRTTVFLKGCPLACKWCHNPEGKRRYPEVIPFVSNCDSCGDCVEACAHGALSLNDNDKPVVDYGLCTTCLQCVEACGKEGLAVWGSMVTVDDIHAEVFSDAPFFKNSGGGVTVSGGEPMLQPDFVRALFQCAREEQVGTALDTCGHVDWALYEKVLDLTDLVLLDIKHMNSAAHRAYTGAGNERILDNAKRIAERGVSLRIRIPVIPGTNDTRENWRETARFAESLGDAVQGVDLLPYHPYAGGKYVSFGMAYDFPAGEGYDDEALEPVIDLFLDHVCEVTIGG
ncbi:MAG: glycyl-radical enzyme activating protein [Desulfatibacillaceae bacterium]